MRDDLAWVFWWVLLLLSAAVAAADAQPLQLASSELTMRTTASVDVQVCAAGVLSDERSAVQAAVLEQLQFLLGRTTAVYLVRQYTTNAGAACFMYVYQAPSPEDAAMAETLIAQQSGDAPNTLLVIVGGQRLQCATAVVPWRGEDPPLPLWQASASDLVLWGGVSGGVLAFCLVVTCCFVALARSEDERRARAILRTDRHALRALFRKKKAADAAVADEEADEAAEAA
jgi:hypothetical protein